MKFDEINVSEDIRRAVSDMGFVEMTPIQEESIPVVMEGRDIIGQAQTGTGKTCAYGIPAIEMTDPYSKSPQVLVLCPTRELASQVAEEMRKLTRYTQSIRILAIYGGQNIEYQIMALKKKPQIIIGTPGRIMDHMRRRTLKLHDLKMLVLDEADEMLNMGFREDIDTILEDIPDERQIMLFSATMPDEIKEIAKAYQHDPKYIHIASENMTADLTEQCYIEVREDSKAELLCRLIDVNGYKLSLVFCNTKRKVDQVMSVLSDRGYAADALHGDMLQKERERVMNKFRRGITQVLAATDIAARGIDVSGVQAVFNYDIPEDPEQYVHRIGRTGRAGNTGKAYSFVFGREMYKLRDIMRYTGSDISREYPPKISEVHAARMNAAKEKIADMVIDGSAEKYISFIDEIEELVRSKSEKDTVSELEKDTVVRTRIAAALFSEAFSEIDDRNYQIADFDEEYFSYDKLDMKRLFVNAGRKDDIKEKDIVKLIASHTSLPGRMIGTIELHGNFSFVDIPKAYVDEVLDNIQRIMLKGRGISVELAEKSGRKSKNRGSDEKRKERRKIQREKRRDQPTARVRQEDGEKNFSKKSSKGMNERQAPDGGNRQVKDKRKSKSADGVKRQVKDTQKSKSADGKRRQMRDSLRTENFDGGRKKHYSGRSTKRRNKGKRK